MNRTGREAKLMIEEVEKKMKLFISADIEGVCGIANWDETHKSHPDYEYFCKEMTREVSAVCEAALKSGVVEEIVIRDAHGTARNIIPDLLPRKTKLLRGWEGTPGPMMTGVENCDAVMMIGYHSGAGMGGNPLAHTQNRENYQIRINGEIASEFLINAFHAAYYNIPVLLISGDEMICKEAGKKIPMLRQVAVNRGMGGAVLSMNPEEARELLEEETVKALKQKAEECLLRLPAAFDIEIEFLEPLKAKKGSYYPGAAQKDVHTVVYSSSDYIDVLRFLMFVL